MSATTLHLAITVVESCNSVLNQSSDICMIGLWVMQAILHIIETLFLP